MWRIRINDLIIFRAFITPNLSMSPTHNAQRSNHPPWWTKSAASPQLLGVTPSPRSRNSPGPNANMPTFVTLPLSSLPPLLPILLRHQQHRRTRTSSIRPLRPAILNKFSLCLTPQHPMTIVWQEKGHVMWRSLLVFIPQRDWERSKAWRWLMIPEKPWYNWLRWMNVTQHNSNSYSMTQQSIGSKGDALLEWWLRRKVEQNSTICLRFWFSYSMLQNKVGNKLIQINFNATIKWNCLTTTLYYY